MTMISGCVTMPQQPGQAEASTTAQPEQHAPDARSAQDSELLAILAGLQDGERSTYMGQAIETGGSYTAASGRTCKQLRLLDNHTLNPTSTRLACQYDSAWFFVVDVFSTSDKLKQ